VAARTWSYVGALTLLASLGALALAALQPAPSPDLAALALLTLGIVVAERTEVLFHWERTSGAFTLVEVAITAGLLLLPPLHVVAVVGPAMVLTHALSRRHPVKLAYNAMTATVATVVAALVLVTLPPLGLEIAGTSVVGVVLGMTAYGIVSVTAFAVLLSRLQDRRTAATLAAQLPLHTATTIGTTSIGVAFAALWVDDPWLTPFVLAPAAAVHFALRASVRATTLLAEQRAEHDRLVRVVDGASDGIVLLDADADVQVWNPAMVRMTAIASEDAVGRPAAQALSPEVRRGERPLGERWTLARALPSAPQREEDARLVDAHGQVRDVRESYAFTFDDRGRCTGAVIVVRDVSRQRELERLRSDFVARVSHELRTPLTPIRGFASVLLRRGEQLDDDQRDEALTRIVERADHLHGLVEDLLLVTRLEHDDIVELVHVVPTDLGPLAQACVDELMVRRPGRTITMTASADVPAALADPDRVRQILAALLDNADRYTPEDTPIEVEVDACTDDVRIRVVDHGAGVPAAHREAIFERFHRVEDPLTMQTSGVGVGLFISRRLAQAMHGHLDLEPSAMGGGATFALRLPIAVPPRDVDEPSDAERTGDISPLSRTERPRR
jgi:PAS domain S-box-containing protein